VPGDERLGRCSFLLGGIGAATTVAAFASSSAVFLLVPGLIGCVAGFFLALAALTGPPPRGLAVSGLVLNAAVLVFWIAVFFKYRD